MRIFVIFALVFLLSSCNAVPEWIGSDNEEILPGTRYDVLPSKSDLKADQSLAGIQVKLPPVAVNTIWLNPNFGQTYHLALKTPLSDIDTMSFGDGPDDGRSRIKATPVIAKDIIYLLDGRGMLTARSTKDLSDELWSADLRGEQYVEGVIGMTSGMEKQEFLGGNIAYADGVVFATTIDGNVVAFDARRGYEIWRRAFNLPIKSSPVSEGGALYFITINNKLYSLDATNGKTLWEHAGITETTGVLGSPAPVIFDDLVLASYSSGEIYALRKHNGAVVWGDSLAALNMHNTSLVALNDIDATPVVYDGVAYSVGHEGVLTATEMTTSKRIWEQEISSLKTPWIAGNFLYIISTNDELICIHRPDGRIKWITPLPSYDNPDNSSGKISWNGPLLGGNRLYVVSSYGQMRVFSPQDGTAVRNIEVEEGIFLPPVVSDRKMYLLSNDADLIILK